MELPSSNASPGESLFMIATQLRQITEHVYWLPPDARTDRPTLGVVSGKKGTLIVEAGNSPSHANLLLSELVRHCIAPPAFVVLTHWHWDHVFGTSAFNVPIIAHQETKRVIQEMAHLDWSDEALERRVAEGVEIEFCRDMIQAELPDRSQLRLSPPDITFVHRIDVDLGDIRCQIVHVGGDHSADSSIVYIPEDGVLFLGDCLYEDLYHGPPSYTPGKLFPLIDHILSYEARVYVLAHHQEPLTRADMAEFTELLRQIGQTVIQHGDNRELVLSALRGVQEASDSNVAEIIDAFLAGLRKNQSTETA